MRPYAVGEDCLVLEAASLVDIHRRYGRYGNMSNRSEEFCKAYRRLCHRRGVACVRSGGSLKTRLYRLFCAGIMKWGPLQEKRQVSVKHEVPLRNDGTERQRVLRNELLARLFATEDGSYCLARNRPLRMPLRKARRKTPRKSYAGRQPCVTQKKKSKEIEHLESPYPIWSPSDSLDDMLVTQGDVCLQPPIATPQQSNLIQPVGQSFKDREIEARRNFHRENLSQSSALASEHELTGKAREDEVSLLLVAYKENMKTFRDCVAMQHETLEHLKAEYDKHRAFLARSLDNLSEQQEHLLRLMRAQAKAEL